MMEKIESYAIQQLTLAAEVARSGNIPLNELTAILKKIYEEENNGCTNTQQCHQII